MESLLDDAAFFNANPNRQIRVRRPRKFFKRNRQRGVDIVFEFAKEYAVLARHKKEQRRVLVWRIPPDNPHYDPDKPGLMQIPFFVDPGETVPDTDEAGRWWLVALMAGT